MQYLIYYQGWPDIEDEVQQEHYLIETGILWDITIARNSTFDFLTIDDVLEENAALKEEVKWLNDVITENITKLNEAVRDLQSAGM